MVKKHYPYIDAIRLFGMFSVIILHSAVYGLRSGYYAGCWWVLNLLTSLCTCAVPLFFMVSGALMLTSPKSDSLEYVVKKRLPRLVVPLVFWSLACVLRDFYYNDYLLYGSINPKALWEALVKGLGAPVAIHLWFMYSLIPLYLLTPFIKRLVQQKGFCSLYLGVWLAACTLKSLYSLVPQSLGIYFNIDLLNKLNLLDGYLGYFILGYLLHKRAKGLKIPTALGLSLGLGLIIAFGTYVYSQKNGGYSEAFKAYTSVWVICLSATLYLGFLNISQGFRARLLQLGADCLARLSLGIYMSGNFFLGAMRYRHMEFNGPKGFVLCCVYTFALCLAFNGLCSLIKPLCFLVTGNPYKSPFKKQGNTD